MGRMLMVTSEWTVQTDPYTASANPGLYPDGSVVLSVFRYAPDNGVARHPDHHGKIFDNEAAAEHYGITHGLLAEPGAPGTARATRVELSGHGAVELLMRSIPTGPDWNHGNPINNWHAANDAVAAADDQTVRAALRRLLSLHLFDLQAKRPKIALRNLKGGDLVVAHGTRYRITKAVRRGDQGQQVYVSGWLNDRIDGELGTFNAGADVEIELLERKLLPGTDQ